MIKSLLTTNELLEFINTNSVVIVKFFASWSNGCSRIRPHYQIFSARYSAFNLIFASVDIDYVGVDNLNALKLKLNLGAIPAFYLFRDGLITSTLITGCEFKLESFVRANIEKDNLLLLKSVNKNSKEDKKVHKWVSCSRKKPKHSY